MSPRAVMAVPCANACAAFRILRGDMRRILVYFVDLCLVAIATFIAVALRDNLEFWSEHARAVVPHALFSVMIAAALVPTLGVTHGVWRFSSLNDYLRIVAACVAIVAAATACTFVYNRLDGISRSVPFIQLLLMVAAMVGVRVGRRLAKASPRGVALASQPNLFAKQQTVLVVGLTQLTELYLRSIAEFAPNRIRVAGLLGQQEQYTGSSIYTYPVLGTPEEAAEIIRKLEVHGVFVQKIVVAKPFGALSMVAQQALLQLEAESTITVEFLAERLGLETGPGRGTRDTEGGAGADPMSDQVAFAFAPAEVAALNSRLYWRLKRMGDAVTACALLIAAAPFFAAVAIAVAIDAGLPVTFWQQRPGRGGRPIHVYKFRTMARPHDAQGRRIPDNLRVSTVGNFLRRTRLDELPQLFSILRGDMSFVGPRPLLPVDQPEAYAARLLVPPGLTGWAQVNGGRDISAADKAALDVWYVRHASPLLDLRILWRTIPMVLIGERIRHHDIQQAWRDLREAGICGPHAPLAQVVPNTAAAGSRQAA